jgi:steroid 5-alpha reductase family enzyme
MNWALPAIVLAAMFVVMSASWATQWALGDAGWTDVFWTFGTGLCLVAVTLAAPGGAPWRHALVAAMVAIWSLRLGLHILGRVVRGPEDARYAQSRRDWGATFQRNMLALSLVQAPATALLSVGVVQAAAAPGAGLRPADIAGLAILLLAVVGEAVADGQLRRFRANPENRGRVCDAGLWAWSRHPNYVFEAAAWWAWPAIALRLSAPWTLASLVTPLTMFALLRFVSGVPPLEAAMARSRGDAWQAYQARVSPFFFRPPRRTPA